MWDRVELPDGTRIERQVMDDTLPGGPTLRTRTWIAPFTLANREDDYDTAWAFFAKQESASAAPSGSSASRGEANGDG
jgi:hypothetical protein